MPPKWALAALTCVLAGSPLSGAVILTFEGHFDGVSITNQYPGLTFSNAVVAMAGVSLNEFEAPPRSPDNVVVDVGGPISILFTPGATLFAGYFTYNTSLTLTGYDFLNNPVASATSLFGSNLALSGDLGSSPNEFLQVSYATGLSRVVITGDLGGDSFAMDDVTVTLIPEPGTLSLFALAGAVMVWARRRSRPSARD